MARFTPRFGFQVVEPGDNPYVNGHKFFSADRDTIDTILWLAMSGHVHDGSLGAVAPPDTAPELALDPVGGTIAAGARIWYTYTLVNQLTGLETGPAPVSFVDTPDPISSPAAPTLAWGSLSGTLLPGQYFYILSAWTDVNTNESTAEEAVGIVVGADTTTNRVIITLPSLPAGADGFNIYRRTPGGSKYLYLASVDMTVATPPTEYVDNGTVDEDCDRGAPYRNTTNATNAITITYPGATPAVPIGYFWKIYRTVTENDWSASLLTTVVEETAENSGIITPEFVDLGFEVTTGEPPSGTFDYSSPSKIDLTDGAHVTGRLPASMVDHIETLTWEMPGSLEVLAGDNQWTCLYDNAAVLAVIANVGPTLGPATTPVIADVNKNGTTIFTTQANRPQVGVGVEVGAIATPDVRLYTQGDRMTVDVDQVDASAGNLVVTVLLAVLAGSTITEDYI
jgi:hypothetical protein